MLTFLLSACLRPVPVAQAPDRTQIELAAVLDSFDDQAVTEPPAGLAEVLGPELERRNLVPVSPDPALVSSFAQIRATDARRAALADKPTPVLLVECAPRFSAQVNGRYRWSVEVDLSLGELPTRSFTVPVHLLYAHEDEDEAAVEAAPMVARELGRLLDDWLALAITQ
jgi:hypothetical protein